MAPREFVEEALPPGLLRLELVVEEKLVDRKGLTCALADPRGVNEPRNAPAPGRALSHGE